MRTRIPLEIHNEDNDQKEAGNVLSNFAKPDGHPWLNCVGIPLTYVFGIGDIVPSMPHKTLIGLDMLQ